MSRAETTIIRVIILSSLILGLGIWVSTITARRYLLGWVEQKIGLKVTIENLSFTLNSHGLGLKLSGVQLQDPTTGKIEKATSATITTSKKFANLRIDISGLASAFIENEKGLFDNPVWERLINNLSQPQTSGGPDQWSVDFEDSQMRVKLVSGGSIELIPMRIYGSKGPTPTFVEGRIKANAVTCVVPPEKEKFVECASDKLAASLAHAFLSESQLLPARLRRHIKASEFQGDLLDVHFNLMTNGDFRSQVRLKSVKWAPAFFALSALKGLDGKFEIQQSDDVINAAFEGAWNNSDINLAFHSKDELTTGSGNAHVKVTSLQSAFPDQPLLSHLFGRAHLDLAFKSNEAGVGWSVRSNLIGVKSTLPKPLNKKSTQANLLEISNRGTHLELAGTRVTYKPKISRMTIAAHQVNIADWSPLLKQTKLESSIRIPALNVTIDSVNYNGKHLGKLQLRSTNEVRIKRFRLETDQQSLVVTEGGWSTEKPHTHLKGWFETKNIGETLELLDMSKKVDGSPFRVGFDVNWLGNPWELKPENLNGRLSGEIAKGQLNATNPVMRRILSLAAVEISNVVSGNLDFDNGRGVVEIKNGHVRTASNLNMKLARMSLSGAANLRDMSIEAGLSVTPLLSESIFNTALTVMVPVAGLTVWALEAEEDSYFNRLKTTRYRVHNSLLDPEFKFEGF
jgi:hypothetical protein